MNIIEKVHAVTQEKVENMDMCFYNCHRSWFSRILIQIIDIILDSHVGPCLSHINYGTHDNYHQRERERERKLAEVFEWNFFSGGLTLKIHDDSSLTEKNYS